MNQQPPRADLGATESPDGSEQPRKPYEPPRIIKRRSLREVTLFSGGGASGGTVATMAEPLPPPPPSMGGR